MNVENNREIKYGLINENGETVGFVYHGDRIVKGKSPNEDAKEFIEFKRYIHHNKFCINSIQQLTNENLSGAEYKVFWFLSEHVRYDNNKVTFDNGEALTVDNISVPSLSNNVLGKSAIYNALRKLIKKEIVFKVNGTDNNIEYFLNPYVIMKGNYVSKQSKSMFEKSKWCKKREVETNTIGKGNNFNKFWSSAIQELSNENLSSTDYKIFWTLAGRLRYSTNLVSFVNGKPMTVKGMMRVSNGKLKESSIYSALSILEKKEMIKKIKLGRTIEYYMNPYITIKGSKISMKTHELFENSKWYELFKAGEELANEIRD